MAQKTAAAILAAGSGTRFEAETPKQFLSLAGRPVMDYAVKAFAAVDQVDAIYIVVSESYLPLISQLQQVYNWPIARMIIGGSCRAESSLAALHAAEKDGMDCLLLHDAARPLVEQATIRRVISALSDYAAVTAAISTADTVAVADDKGCIASIPSRSQLWNIQTPQGFCTAVLREAYERCASLPNFVATDDCGVVKTAFPALPVALVEGSRQAIKLTYPTDIAVLSAWLEASNESGFV